METSPALAADGAMKTARANSVAINNPSIGTIFDCRRCSCDSRAGNSLLNPTIVATDERDRLNSRLLFMGFLIRFSGLNLATFCLDASSNRTGFKFGLSRRKVHRQTNTTMIGAIDVPRRLDLLYRLYLNWFTDCSRRGDGPHPPSGSGKSYMLGKYADSWGFLRYPQSKSERFLCLITPARRKKKDARVPCRHSLLFRIAFLVPVPSIPNDSFQIRILRLPA